MHDGGAFWSWGYRVGIWWIELWIVGIAIVEDQMNKWHRVFLKFLIILFGGNVSLHLIHLGYYPTWGSFYDLCSVVGTFIFVILYCRGEFENFSLKHKLEQ